MSSDITVVALASPMIDYSNPKNFKPGAETLHPYWCDATEARAEVVVQTTLSNGDFTQRTVASETFSVGEVDGRPMGPREFRESVQAEARSLKILWEASQSE